MNKAPASDKDKPDYKEIFTANYHFVDQTKTD